MMDDFDIEFTFEMSDKVAGLDKELAACAVEENTLANTPIRLGETAFAMKSFTRMETRGFTRLFANLKTLGIINAQDQKIWQKINSLTMIFYSGMMMYQAYVSIRNAMKNYLAMRAAAETAANANPVLFWKIILAAGMTAAIMAGLYAGTKVGSGEWNFSGDNIANRWERQRRFAEIREILHAEMDEHGLAHSMDKGGHIVAFDVSFVMALKRALEEGLLTEEETRKYAAWAMISPMPSVRV